MLEVSEDSFVFGVLHFMGDVVAALENVVVFPVQIVAGMVVIWILLEQGR